MARTKSALLFLCEAVCIPYEHVTEFPLENLRTGEIFVESCEFFVRTLTEFVHRPRNFHYEIVRIGKLSVR